MSGSLVRELRSELGDSADVIYVNEKNGYNTYSSMSDSLVMQLGYALDAYIITANQKHFRSYHKLIPIPSKKNTRLLMNEVMKYLKKD